ncbi:MAG: ABC transporter ATP-binding protein [Deltaproteobacteria bacterium]
MSTPVLKTSGLTKRFSEGFFRRAPAPAVADLDLEVRAGEIFGVLGPNGAGKTTTLNMLVGVARPTSGTIELFGAPFVAGDTRPFYRIGYVPETTVLPDFLSVQDLLSFFGSLFGLPRGVLRKRIEHLLDVSGLTKERHHLLRYLSAGQRRQVDFIQALVHDPDLVILDEPTVYLDPVILQHFRQTLTGLRQAGKTVLMSTHSLVEIEKLCDRVAVLHRGRCLKVEGREEFLRAGGMEEEFMRIIRHED